MSNEEIPSHVTDALAALSVDKIAADYAHPPEKVQRTPYVPKYDDAEFPGYIKPKDKEIVNTQYDKYFNAEEATMTNEPETEIADEPVIPETSSMDSAIPELQDEPYDIPEYDAEIPDDPEGTPVPQVEEPEPVASIQEEDSVSNQPAPEEEVGKFAAVAAVARAMADSYEMQEQAPDEPAPEEPKRPLDIKKQYFKVTWEPKFKRKEGTHPNGIMEELSIHRQGVKEYNERIGAVTDKDELQKGDEWEDFTNMANNSYQTGEVFIEPFEREGSDWGQAVDSDVGPLALSKPTFGKNNTNISGDKAVLKMSAILNLGQLMSVPLWNTGIWIKLKAPSDGALLALENRIAEEKAKLGRQSMGMIFSNTSVFVNDYLLDLIFSCVYDCSYEKNTPDDLRELIKISDITALVWGFLCAIYPNGYPLAQPCINNPEKCRHIEHEMVMISKLMWVDKSLLTPAQVKHMSRRDQRMSLDEIKRYQDDHRIGGDKVYDVNGNLKIMLSVPTIAEYIANGYEWVESVERMVTESFPNVKSGEERNNYILAMSQTQLLRQYGHWVKQIQVFEDPEDIDNVFIIDDIETIAETMDTLSKDKKITETIVGHVSKYIDLATISIVGIPRYSCPVCSEDQGKFLPVDRYIIPLDIIKIFFTLQNQRLLKVIYSIIE